MATSELGLSRTFSVTFTDLVRPAALEAFIPGFELAKTVILTCLGIDLTGVVARVFVCCLVGKALTHAYNSVDTALTKCAYSSVLISQKESAHEDVLEYVAEKYLDKGFKVSSGSRILTLTSAKPTLKAAIVPERASRAFRYDSTITAGWNCFFHNGKTIFFKRVEKSRSGIVADTSTTSGRSTQPVGSI